jgi:uncharacterized protein (TIGR02118 family)
MIKTVHGMHIRDGMTIEELHHNWFENHGPIVSIAPRMLRYIQHITLPGAYGKTPAPTHDGASMCLFESLDDFWFSWQSPEWDLQRVDAPNWFAPGSDFCAGVEHVVVDGVAHTVMVKAIFMVCRAPELSIEEFQRQWIEERAPLAARLPGLRRYVLNVPPPEAYEGVRPLTLDGWSEMWFDNLDDLHSAFASPEGAAMLEEANTPFDMSKLGVVIARERPVVLEPRY